MGTYNFFGDYYLHAHAVNYYNLGLSYDSSSGKGSPWHSYSDARKQILDLAKTRLNDKKLSKTDAETFEKEISSILSKSKQYVDKVQNKVSNITKEEYNEMEKAFNEVGLTSGILKATTEMSERGDIEIDDPFNKLKKLYEEDNLNGRKNLTSLNTAAKENLNKIVNGLPIAEQRGIDTTSIKATLLKLDSLKKDYNKGIKNFKKTGRIFIDFSDEKNLPIKKYLETLNELIKELISIPSTQAVGFLGELVGKLAVKKCAERGMFELSKNSKTKWTGKETDKIKLDMTNGIFSNYTNEDILKMLEENNKNKKNSYKLENDNGDRILISVSETQVKADVYAGGDEKGKGGIGFNIKNYAIGVGRSIQVESGASFYSMLQDHEKELSEFYAHYFNLTATHVKRKTYGAKTQKIREKKGSDLRIADFKTWTYADAHNAMKLYLLYIALAGRSTRKFSSDYFLVIDHSKENTSDKFVFLVPIYDYLLIMNDRLSNMANTSAVSATVNGRSLINKNVFSMQYIKDNNKDTKLELAKQRIRKFTQDNLLKSIKVKTNISVDGVIAARNKMH